MSSIIPQLYISDAETASDDAFYEENQIGEVVKLTHSSPAGGYPAAVTVHDHPLIDGPQNNLERLHNAVATTCSLLEQESCILVHCSAGSSRSATVAATALAIHERIELSEALEVVDDARPIDPHPALIENAVAVLNEESA